MDPASTSLEDRLAAAERRIAELERDHSGCVEELSSVRLEAEERSADAQASRDELQYFVYAASHDLQQPLRAIGTHAQLLQRQFPENAEAKEFTDVIIDGATQMNTLITDLLKYSRIGSAANQKSIHLNASVQWALFNLAKAIEQSGAKVTLQDLPEVFADETQLATVFEHIVSNAIKYRGGDPPEVKIASEVDGDFHLISVQDNGVGIKSEYHEKVFEPFKRLHSKDIPGSGLGLSICRKIVRAHRGKIWVESDGANGSLVKFTIPV